jgi:membrane protein YdbS with pleckstrin-like domain
MSSTDPPLKPATKYLLDTERLVINVRRHWIIVAKPVGAAIGSLLALLIVLAAVPQASGAAGVLVSLVGVVWLWAGWQYFEWWVERFVVTDQRLLLVSGIIARKVAIMPLSRVTDLTYERSVAGRILGYGEFIAESAGQDQALSRVGFLPHPDQLYLSVSRLLFGS